MDCGRTLKIRMGDITLSSHISASLPIRNGISVLIASAILSHSGLIPESRTYGFFQAPAAPVVKKNGQDVEVLKNGTPVSPISNAQKIAELRSQIDSEEKQLVTLKKQLEDQALPESKFSKAETKFKNLDSQVKEAKNKIADIKSREQPDVELLAEAEHELAEAESKRGDALKAFEFEIVENRTLQEKILTIEKKVAADKTVLDRISKPAETAQTKKSETEVKSPSQDVQKAAAEKAAQNSTADAQKSTEAKPKPEKTVAGTIVSTATGGLISPDSKSTNDKTDPKPSDQPKSLIAIQLRQKVEKYQQLIEDLTAQLETARQDEAMAAEQVANLDKQVDLEAKLRDNARKKSDLANEMVAKKQDEFREKSLADASQTELKQLADRLLELQKEFQSARDESRLHSNRLQDIQNERSKQQEVLRQAREKTLQLQKQIAEAQAEIASLKNPASFLNILDWLTTRGIRIIILFLTMIVLRAVLRSLGSRTIRVFIQSQSKSDKEDQNDRAETLVSVYSNAVSVTVIGGGLLLIAQEAGVPIGPLLGGAAIFGVAIAFGAQSLVKDYFYGFVILLENQFSVNDVIQVGAITGVVERITLRMSVVRDVAGTVHFLPNGSITMVSNYSYDWARAVVEIPVSYKADVDEVIREIMVEGKKLRQDREFGPLCLEDLTMLGVDSLNETSVLIKFYIKTKPLKQWPVKRELLRRIKMRFDALGIEHLTTVKAVLGGTFRADQPMDNIGSGPNQNGATRAAV